MLVFCFFIVFLLFFNSSSSSSSNQIIVTLEPCLQLRSDVLVKCYNKSTSHLEDPSNREMIFRCQFHTCAINNNLLKFGKNDLDEAYQDARFPSHGQVEFVLSDSSLNWNSELTAYFIKKGSCLFIFFFSKCLP